MNLNSKHIKAILKVSHLRKELLEDPISEDDCLNYDSLDAEKKEIIQRQVMYVMNHGYADLVLSYSNPDEQYINPIDIYGETGIYLVSEVDYEIFTFFTNKRDAIKYANKAYDEWLKMNSYDEEKG
jgi:hypothetical protein